MVEQRQGRRPGKVLGGVRPTSEDHRPTTFELFFDLVYVFAATQVTGYMAHEHSGHGVAQGLLLALLWWTWSAYAWLGNQARVDEGVLRVGMAVAMAAIFVVALTIPEAWHDAPGGLDGPLVLVGAYLLVRCAHFMLYTVAATGDRELRHQLTISSAPLLASAALLVPEALLWAWPPPSACGGCTSTWRRWRPSTGCWRWTASPGPGWPLRPAPMDISRSSPASCSPPWASRACWPTRRRPSRWAASMRRRCGAALYLAGYLVFKQRMHGALGLPRLVAIGMLLAALPAAIVLPPLVGLAGLALILAALVGFETIRYAQIRRSLRNP